MESKTMTTQTAVVALAALAQASRLTIFRLLVQAGLTGLAAGKISQITEIAPSSLSFHLKALTHAALITPRQEGRFIFYVADFSTITQLMAYLTENCCQGKPCEPVTPFSVSDFCPPI
jgi:DNA-binding transcriptional ArsR family regulator